MQLLFKKNTILVWEWLRIIVGMFGSRSVQASKVFFKINVKRTSIYDTRIIKVCAMVE